MPPTKNRTAYKQVSLNLFNHRPLVSSTPTSPTMHRAPNNEDDFVGNDEDTVVCNTPEVQHSSRPLVLTLIFDSRMRDLTSSMLLQTMYSR